MTKVGNSVDQTVHFYLTKYNVTHDTTINRESVVTLRKTRADQFTDRPIPLVLDNARYQRNALFDILPTDKSGGLLLSRAGLPGSSRHGFLGLSLVVHRRTLYRLTGRVPPCSMLRKRKTFDIVGCENITIMISTALGAVPPAIG